MHRLALCRSARPIFARLVGPAVATAFMIAAAGTIPSLAGAASPVSLSPASGTPDASPDTQISILGPAAAAIRSVTVTGSTSGRHGGHLAAYNGRPGASYVLGTPLAQGEHVSVEVRIRGRGPVHTSFTVARQPPAVAPFLTLSNQQPDKLDHFVSRSDLLPPKIAVYKATPDLGGDIFLTPLPSPTVHTGGGGPLLTLNPVGPGGPMIVDDQGRLVWFKQLPPDVEAANLRTATYDGKRVLTWWEGRITGWAYGVGEGVLADTSYHEVARVRAGNGYAADIHELSVTPDGDALIAIYSPVCVSDTCLPAGTDTTMWPVIDAIVQQVDVKTGLVEWEWHAVGHVPTADAIVPPSSFAFDPYHINSIQALPGDRVLISLRNTSAIYNINKRTGAINWTLGGRQSSFQMGPGAGFHFQHDAQLTRDGRTITLFDDASGPPVFAPGYSRGLELRVDTVNKTATLQHEYVRSTDTIANSEGSVQKLRSGDKFVGFGSAPFVSQFGRDGDLKFDAALPADDGSYRAFRFPWSATPDTKPDVAAKIQSRGDVAVYASWNGATEIASWRVLAGDSAPALSPVTSALRRGFETRIDVHSSATTFAVQALNRGGEVLATSAPVTAS